MAKISVCFKEGDEISFVNKIGVTIQGTIVEMRFPSAWIKTSRGISAISNKELRTYLSDPSSTINGMPSEKCYK